MLWMQKFKNPGNVKSGQKSGSGTKIRIQNSGKFFFDFLYFSIVNNFCKISFFLKRLFTQKKYVFCIFHVLQLPPANQTAYIIYVVKEGKNLAKSFTSSKSPQYFFPGKNRIRKIREKSGHQIFIILGQISRMDSMNYHFIV